MSGRSSTKSVRDRILTERGLQPVQQAKGKHKRLKRVPVSANDSLKTPLMKYIETQHGKRIEDMLMAESESRVATRLKISKGTVSKWIKKLQLRWSADNLPSCQDCIQPKLICTYSLCWKLIEAGLWELVELKKKIMKETQDGI